MQLDFAFSDADLVQEGTLFSIVGRRGVAGRGSVLREKVRGGRAEREDMRGGKGERGEGGEGPSCHVAENERVGGYGTGKEEGGESLGEQTSYGKPLKE